ncbi:hypothetical protein WJX75_001625 [Coccomyxa subellipsoidea]|uniref:Uncharacterized protein n=1 Tax=Coccomyxa subellipsoidea TaxID=248742 RepID=A0ABR2YX65_9CHLO
MGNAWKKHPNPARPSMRIADAFILLPQAEQDAYDAAERGEAPGLHMGSTSAGRSDASPVGRLTLRGPPPSPEKTIKEG